MGVKPKVPTSTVILVWVCYIENRAEGGSRCARGVLFPFSAPPRAASRVAHFPPARRLRVLGLG